MVGVAGKSKGCATCRKRKIKCDETKPICRRCQQSRLQCDRYERFPVFINRNQTGFQKRLPLEEVKPFPRLPPYPQPQRILSPEAESIRLIAWLRESYLSSLPSQHALQAPTQTHWLGLVGAHRPPHPALKEALLALSFVKWSRVEQNPGLKQSGRRHYQQSLGLTQKALLSTETALSDDILGSACVMTLYELFDPSSQRSDNWLDHIAGVGNLLCLRGPGEFASVESRAILEHIRYIFMIRCLAIKSSCVFGSSQWRQLPWAGVAKSVEQQVFDQGLRLTSLWKDCGQVSLEEYQQVDALLSTCIDIFETLNPLIAQMSPEIAHTDTDGAINTAALLLTITALGVQLGAAATADKLLTTTSNTAASWSNIAISDTTFETVIKAQSLSQARRPLAQRILASVEAGMKTRAGALGALRMLWSLQLAQEQFTPVDPETEQCQVIQASLSQRTFPFDVLTLPLDRCASSPVYCSS